MEEEKNTTPEQNLITAPKDISEPPNASQQNFQETYRLEQSLKGGAGWFYAIAGLSFLNSVIALFRGTLSFIFGLGITQLVDGAGGAFGRVGSVFALFVNFFIVLIFVAMGYFAGKSKRWAFIAGMILYGIDGLIFLLVSDFVGFGFHIFAIFSIWSGYKAISALEAIKQNESAPSLPEGSPR